MIQKRQLEERQCVFYAEIAGEKQKIIGIVALITYIVKKNQQFQLSERATPPNRIGSE